MKYFIKKYYLLLFSLVTGACANIVTPSGGAKDITPPRVTGTSPAAFSKEFKEKSFRLDFDEFVKVTDASSQIMVSPFMKEAPEIKLKGKAIIVELKDTLKAETTYSVGFGKSIADVNEGNVLLNYSYVFSTGSAIDSLTLKGAVKNSFTLKPEAGIIVALYDQNYDSVPYKETPFYVAKTNETGEFNFSGLRAGAYKIFGLKDDNRNFIFDQPTENIAFLDSLVVPMPKDTAKADSLKKEIPYKLYLFEELPAAQRLLKSFAAGYGKVVFIFRKPVSDLSTEPLNNNIAGSWNLREINKTRDTVILWLKNPDMDSLLLLVKDNNVILDTARISTVKKGLKRSKERMTELKNTIIKTNVSNNGSFDFYKSVTLETSAPVTEYDFGKIIFVENNDTIKAAFVFTDSVKRKISLENKLKEETKYILYIPPGTFKDMTGLANDTVKINFKTTAAKDYCKIKLKIKSAEECSYIVRLVNDNDAVIQEKFTTPGNTVIDFENVSPGNYNIKAVCDKNNNKKWDTGNYMKKIQPEKVFYYSPSSFAVKVNWDSDLDWKIDNR